MTKLIKNISLVILTGLFFIINSGFTLTTHYCNMQQKTSFSGCGMCEEQSIADDDCSHEDANSGEVVISSVPNKCCEITLSTIAGTDQYLIDQVGSNLKLSQVSLILTVHQLSDDLVFTNFGVFSDSSPPSKNDTPIFLSNQNFRI